MMKDGELEKLAKGFAGVRRRASDFAAARRSEQPTPFCQRCMTSHVDNPNVCISNLEDRVVEAAMNWYRQHGYIPNLAAAHYEVPLIKATCDLMKAREDQK